MLKIKLPHSSEDNWYVLQTLPYGLQFVQYIEQIQILTECCLFD